MGSGEVAIVALSTMISLKVTFSDGLGGGKLGRPSGSIKSQDKKMEEYREVINLLKKGYAIRDVAKLTGKGISTVQRVKKEFVA